MRRIIQVALCCSVLSLTGCNSEPTEPPKQVEPVVTGPTAEQKAMAVMQAKLELVDIRAKRDRIVDLRLMMMTNGRDLTPEEQVKHDETLKGLEMLEQQQLQIIAENEK